MNLLRVGESVWLMKLCNSSLPNLPTLEVAVAEIAALVDTCNEEINT